MADARDLVGEEVLRNRKQDAGAIARLAIGVHRTTVPDGLQRPDRQLHHLPTRLAIDRADEADAARVALVGGGVGVGGGEAFAIGEVALHFTAARSGGDARPGEVLLKPCCLEAVPAFAAASGLVWFAHRRHSAASSARCER